MSEPRFLIVRGNTELGVSVPEWPTREDPFAVLNLQDGPWFSWRLLSGNNRELGRGASAYPTELGCLAAIARSQHRAAIAAPLVSVRPTGHWGWQLELDGQRIAVAGRAYQRQRECRYNLGQFLLALPVAQRPTASERPVSDDDGGARIIPLRRPQSPYSVPPIRIITSTERLRRTRMAP